ncbi:MAG TPA: hypothetical protein VL172_09945, partial [Kofleriaceae bacterium]|nr:hypothetical protein [Kofleriaceae bacterium]
APTAESACGVCPADTACLTYYPVREQPGPPAHACERACTPGADPCADGQYCAMLSDGPGFVCRPRPAPAAHPPAIERLARLGRLWGVIRYQHPYLAYRPIDLDAAVLAAIPRVRDAAGDEAYLAAVRDLLAALGDPVTRLVPEAPVAAAVHPGATRWQAPGVLVIDVGTTGYELFPRLDAIAADVARARQVVFDLRSTSADSILPLLFASLDGLLVAAPTELPSSRALVHSGYRSQRMGSGEYYTAFEIRPAAVVAPARKQAPLAAFLTGPSGALPEVAVPLQQAGRAVIVAGEPLARALVTTTRVPVAPGWVAEVRIDEPLLAGRPLTVVPDAVDTSDPLGHALALLAHLRPRPRAPAGATTPGLRWQPDAPYAGAEVPSMPLRILAVYRLWNVIRYFYPYLELLDDWDPVLADGIAAVAGADSWPAYLDALVRLDARVADGHSSLAHPRIGEVLPQAQPPILVDMVQGQAVITAVMDPRSSLKIGDVITAVDGEPTSARFRRLAPLQAASTPWAHRAAVAHQLVAGPDESLAKLALLHADGTRGRVDVSRHLSWMPEPEPAPASAPAPPSPPPPPSYRIIAPGIGYADLTMLQAEEVAPMFAALADTKVLLLDMRGYPNGTAWAIAPRLNRHPEPTPAARFERCRVVGGALEYPSVPREGFVQPLPLRAGVTPYTGRTAMIIDERAISQSEHSGLMFEAANGTVFIGGRSAGANGDVTSFVLPGGVVGYFTGHDVRHADGRQLQRVGLVPAVPAEPTLAGVRAMRDEVLDAAVAWARSQR